MNFSFNIVFHNKTITINCKFHRDTADSSVISMLNTCTGVEIADKHRKLLERKFIGSIRGIGIHLYGDERKWRL